MATHLKLRGNECYVLARHLTLNRARIEGFSVFIRDNSLSFPCDFILDSNNPNSIFDLIIVAVKRYNNEEIAELIPQWLKPSGHVLTIQNGIGADEVLAAFLKPGQSISVGTILACLRRDGLTKIVQDGGATTTIKLDRNSIQNHPVLEVVSRSLRKSGIFVVKSSHIRAETWRKTIFISTYGGLSVMTGLAVGGIRSSTELMATLNAGFYEGIDIATNNLVKSSENEFELLSELFHKLPNGNRPSLSKDFVLGVRSELPHLLGTLINSAKKSSIPCPVLEFIEAGLSVINSPS